MSSSTGTSSFRRQADIDPSNATLIEGLPGHGLVASIAGDQITKQLALTQFGSITADDFPLVTTYDDGLVQDLVRVYAGTDPSVLTLKSDLALPERSFDPLSDCVLGTLREHFDRAVFLAGAPAQSEKQLGQVTGIGTTAAIKDDLEAAGIAVPEEPGIVGGITGAFVRECHNREIPAALLIVRSHPQLPDPAAAKAVIEDALEPLVDFDIDTTELDEQADQIQQRMEQIAEQYQSMVEQQAAEQQVSHPGMFQ